MKIKYILDLYKQNRIIYKPIYSLDSSKNEEGLYILKNNDYIDYYSFPIKDSLMESLINNDENVFCLKTNRTFFEIITSIGAESDIYFYFSKMDSLYTIPNCSIVLNFEYDKFDIHKIIKKSNENMKIDYLFTNEAVFHIQVVEVKPELIKLLSMLKFFSVRLKSVIFDTTKFSSDKLYFKNIDSLTQILPYFKEHIIK